MEKRIIIDERSWIVKNEILGGEERRKEIKKEIKWNEGRFLINKDEENGRKEEEKIEKDDDLKGLVMDLKWREKIEGNKKCRGSEGIVLENKKRKENEKR